MKEFKVFDKFKRQFTAGKILAHDLAKLIDRFVDVDFEKNPEFFEYYRILTRAHSKVVLHDYYVHDFKNKC